MIRHGMASPALSIDPSIIRRRFLKTREDVCFWLELFPPVEEPVAESKTPVILDPGHQRMLHKIASQLSTAVPTECFVLDQRAPALIVGHGEGTQLLLSPQFLSSPEAEQKFHLARAAYRHASGLERLYQRARNVMQFSSLRQKAMAYAEWNAHSARPLEELHPEMLVGPELLAALEDMYWDTQDATYQRMALIVHHGGWCPLFDREADLFAGCFADLTSSSYALVKTDLWERQIEDASDNVGLESLIVLSETSPTVCLRLQTLWIESADYLQRLVTK